MTTIERIDLIYEKIQNQPLSAIVPMIQPIALECGDYEGYCCLTYWSKPMAKDKAANVAMRAGMHRVLLGEGLGADKIAEIENNGFNLYLKMRTMEKDLVLSLSAKEMEDQIKAFDDMISAVEVPNELHPLDLYYRSQTAEKEKLIVIENRRKIEHQYAVLHSYITTKLTEYRRKITLSERKKSIEKGIRNSKDVFIIHGHSEAKLLELEKILKDEFHLNPIILKDKPNSGLTIIDKFEKYASSCSYAFALFTPDDIVTNGKGEQYFQARPNVIFELGWFYANLGRNRVCILEQASDKSEIFSDLQGILRIQFNRDVEESYMKIKRELEDVGII